MNDEQMQLAHATLETGSVVPCTVVHDFVAPQTPFSALFGDRKPSTVLRVIDALQPTHGEVLRESDVKGVVLFPWMTEDALTLLSAGYTVRFNTNWQAE